MVLLFVFSLVWCVALWLFKDWFSTGLASSILALAFGVMSLYCSIFGDQLRLIALRLDAVFGAFLPRLWSTAFRVRLPAPDLVVLVLLLLAFTNMLGLSTIGWLHELVERGDIQFRGNTEHQLFLILRVIGTFILAAVVPTLIMYGVVRSALKRDESFSRLVLACALGVTLASISLAIVREKWWFLDAHPVALVGGLVLVSCLLASLVRLGLYLGHILVHRNEA